MRCASASDCQTALFPVGFAESGSDRYGLVRQNWTIEIVKSAVHRPHMVERGFPLQLVFFASVGYQRTAVYRLMLATFLPRDRYQRILFCFFLTVFVTSCIKPPYLDFLLMQHVPTVLAGLLLAYFSNRFLISRLSFASIVLFLCLHTLGARYLYSYVPYDAWSEHLFGVNITQMFGFQRNHYDRLVHFSFGLLLAVPVQEFERRYFRLSLALSSGSQSSVSSPQVPAMN